MLTLYDIVKKRMPKEKPVLEGLINKHSNKEELHTVNELNMFYNSCLSQLQEKLSGVEIDEIIHSAIMGSYVSQRLDEEIIDWDNRVFDTRLLAKKVIKYLEELE